MSPDINDTAVIKQMRESGSTIPGGVRNYRSSTVKRTIKNCVEIATYDSGHCWIDPRGNLIKKLVPCRVTIRRIQGDNTKQFALKTELTQHKTTSIIRRRIDKGQTRTKKNDTTTLGPHSKVVLYRGSLWLGRGKPPLHSPIPKISFNI